MDLTILAALVAGVAAIIFGIRRDLNKATEKAKKHANEATKAEGLENAKKVNTAKQSSRNDSDQHIRDRLRDGSRSDPD